MNLLEHECPACEESCYCPNGVPDPIECQHWCAEWSDVEDFHDDEE